MVKFARSCRLTYCINMYLKKFHLKNTAKKTGILFQMFFRQKSLRYSFLANFTCHAPAFLPFEFRSLKARTTTQRLAEVWSSSVAGMIRNGRNLQIVRFEDLILDPQYASKSILQRLGMTIAVPELNRIKRYRR